MGTIDRLTPLFERFRVRTRLFHSGPLCGVTDFSSVGQGFLHVLRRGELDMTVVHDDGSVHRTHITRPSLLFFPRPIRHSFFNAPTDESDFACATLDFDGGATHPVVRTLPPVIVIDLDDLAELRPALELLFAEVDNVRCGRPVVADRLFEVVLIQVLRWMLDHTDALQLPPGLLPALGDERLAPTLIALHADPGRGWNLDLMAREANMSRSAFAARFKEVVGRTPADYLTDWRLSVAQDRLLSGASITAVSIDLGYSSPSAFTRAFTQRIGTAPRAWLAAAG